MKKLLLLYLILNIQTIAGNAYQELTFLYENYGNEKYMIQEEITQKNHVLQAAYFAKQADAPEYVIIGLLFHDIGQIADKENLGNIELLHHDHDELGATWLIEHGFPQKVADLVRYHTIAKVTLCDQNPNYFDHLSLASKISYEIQKRKYATGPEKTNFLKHQLRDDFWAARWCDDMAKIADLDERHIPSFNHYQDMIERVRNGHGKPANDPHWKHTLKILHTAMCKNRTAFEHAVKTGILKTS